MRSLLNNPWAVAVLCGIALGLISWNLIPEGTANVGQIETKPIPTASLDRGPSYDIALLDWHDSSARDPFRLDDVVPISQPSSAITHAAEAIIALDAVSMQPGEPMAVINGTMVVVGESIEGYRVTDIQSDAVWLEGPLGPKQIGF